MDKERVWFNTQIKMTHVVPILCLLLFIGFVEYRLKKHLDDVDRRVSKLEEQINNPGSLDVVNYEDSTEKPFT